MWKKSVQRIFNERITIGSRYRRKDRDGNLVIVLNKDYKKSVNHHFKDQGSNMVKKVERISYFFI